FRSGATKPQLLHLKPIDKRIDEPNHIILADVVVEHLGKQNPLLPAFSSHVAHRTTLPSITKMPQFTPLFSYREQNSCSLGLSAILKLWFRVFTQSGEPLFQPGTFTTDPVEAQKRYCT